MFEVNSPQLPFGKLEVHLEVNILMKNLSIKRSIKNTCQSFGLLLEKFTD